MQVKANSRKEILQRLQQLLLKRADALRKALQGDLSLLTEMEKQTTGELADFALDSAQFEMSSQLIDMQSRELKQVEAAIERMKKGKFGSCEGCGCTISLPRLMALPYTTMCIDCAEHADSSSSRRRPASRSTSDDDEEAVDSEMYQS